MLSVERQAKICIGAAGWLPAAEEVERRTQMPAKAVSIRFKPRSGVDSRQDTRYGLKAASGPLEAGESILANKLQRKE